MSETSEYFIEDIQKARRLNTKPVVVRVSVPSGLDGLFRLQEKLASMGNSLSWIYSHNISEDDGNGNIVYEVFGIMRKSDTDL